LLYKRLVSAGHGKFHVLLSLGCGMCLVAMMSEVFGISFLIPAAECEFNMSSSEKGLLNAIGYIGERDLFHVNKHVSHRIDSLSGDIVQCCDDTCFRNVPVRDIANCTHRVSIEYTVLLLLLFIFMSMGRRCL
jgi:hypothetical protein